MNKQNFWFGILVITLVFAMTAVGCVEDPTDGSGGGDEDDLIGGDEDDLIGGDGSMGSTLTITNTQVYSINWSNGATIQFDGTVQGLTCIGVVSRDATTVFDEPKLLNNFIDGNPTVTLTNGKLNITLGTPKASSLNDLNASTMPSGITVSTTGVKTFSISSICNSSGDTDVLQYQPYIVYSLERYPRVLVTYTYSNKDVNISGKSTDAMSTYTYAMNLKAGWNSVIQTITEGTSLSVIRKTGKPPDDCTWIVRMYE